MKSSKSFNNVSKKLLAQIPRLKPGETVVFKMLNGSPNPDPDPAERYKDPVLYPKVELLTQFRIFDPYQTNEKGEEVGGYVDVGCVESWQGDNPVSFRSFVTGIVNGAQTVSRFQGKFQLRGGVVADEELFEIFWLSPQRKGTLCPDATVEQIFEIQDLKSEVKSTLTKVDRLKKAIAIFDTMKEEDAVRVMSALNQPAYQDKEVLMAKTKEFAVSNVELFLSTFENPDSYVIADIKEAADKGIISYDYTKGTVSMGNILLASLLVDGEPYVKKFADWIKRSANGQEVISNIRNQIRKTKPIEQETGNPAS